MGNAFYEHLNTIFLYTLSDSVKGEEDSLAFLGCLCGWDMYPYHREWIIYTLLFPSFHRKRRVAIICTIDVIIEALVSLSRQAFVVNRPHISWGRQSQGKVELFIVPSQRQTVYMYHDHK